MKLFVSFIFFFQNFGILLAISEIYIGNRTFPSGNGTIDNPYNNLIEAFSNTVLSPNETYYFIMVSDFLTLLDIDINSSNSSLVSYDSQRYSLFFSNSSSLQITLIPLICYQNMEISCSETTTISIKTERALFFVSGSLTLINIILSGMDLPLNYTSPIDDSCYFSAECCNLSAYNNNSLVNARCYLRNKLVNRTSANFLNYSLFLIAHDNSFVGLYNSEINNFYSINKTKSYGFLFWNTLNNSVNVSIVLNNTILNNTYFLYGLIKSTNVNFEIISSVLTNYNNYSVVEFQGTNQTMNFMFYLKNATLIVNNCQISDCTGIFSIYNGDFNISNSIISTVYDQNPALTNNCIIIFSNSSVIFIENVQFINNSLKTYTSLQKCFFYISRNSNFTISDSVFSNATLNNHNITTGISNNVILIKNFTIFNVSALLTTQSFCFSFNANNRITIQDSFISSINFSGNGGAFYLYSLNILLINNLTITNIVSIQSIASYGCICFYVNNNNITVNNSSINELSILNGGGTAFYTSSTNNQLTLFNCTFSSLVGTGTGSIFYFPLYHTLTVNACDFVNISTVNSNGGVFYLPASSSLTLMNSFFDNCTGTAGTILYADDNSIVTIQEVMTKNTMASTYAGIFVFCATDLVLQNSIFKNSTAKEWAGGIYFYFKANISLFENVFMKDMYIVSGAGGSIYFETNSIATIVNLVIENSQTVKAFQPSGSIHIKSTSNLLFLNCIFNISQSDQGGVAALDTGNNVTFYQSFFLNSSAVSQGGIFSLNIDNILNISQCNFLLSSSSQGGAFYLNSYNLIYFESLMFKYGFGLNGGVLYCNLNCNVSLFNSIFEYNYAVNLGGDIYLSQNNSLQITNCSFTNSSSLYSAGSFYLGNNNNLKIQNATFINISSLSSGGVFEVDIQNNIQFYEVFSGNIFIKQDSGFMDLQYSNNVSFNNFILENFSSSAFGFININQNNIISLYNISIKNGVSFNGAGVLSLYSGNQLFINFSSFGNITSFSDSGLLVMNLQNYLEINNSEIINITSSQEGGVFSLSDNNTAIIFNTNIQNIEVLQLYGGIMWAKSSNIINFAYITIINCTADDSGGMLYLQLFNLVNISFANISQIFAGDSGGGLIYSFSSNNISIENTVIYNVSALSTGGVFNLQSLNFLSLTNVSIDIYGIYLEYGGMLYSLESNNFSSENCNFNDSFFPTGFYGMFIYAFDLNSIYLENNIVDSANFSNENANFIFSYNLNNMTLVDFDLNIGLCFCLFYIGEESIFSFVNLNLIDTVSSKIAFQVYSSNLTFQRAVFNLQIHFNFLIGSDSTINFLNYSLNPYINITLQLTDVPSYYLDTINGRALFNLDSCFMLFNQGQIKMKNNVNASGIQMSGGSLKIFKTTVLCFKTNEISKTISTTSIQFLSVKKSLFLINRAFNQNGGVFTITYPENQAGTVKFSFSNFFFNSAQQSAGCLYLSFNQSNLNIILSFQNNKFQNNIAQNAGVLYLYNGPNTTIQNCSFINNQAVNPQNPDFSNVSLSYNSSKGGAFYFKTNEFSEDSLVSLINNKFLNNKADIGGVIYQEGPIKVDFPMNISLSTLNSATFYGNFIATETQTIYFLSDISLDLLIYKIKNQQFVNVISGFTYDPCLGYIAGLDSYSQLTFMNNENLISSLAIIDSDLNLEVTLNFAMEFNLLCLSGPFTRDSLPIQATKNYQIFYNNQNSHLDFQLNYRSCELGERLADNFSCIACLRGEYLFENNPDQPSPYCYLCGAGTPFNCFGGNLLTPKPGYWRKNADTINFMECLESYCLGDPRDMNDENVQYNEIYAQGLCSQGYTGVLCNECEDGYGKVGDDLCELCANFNYFGAILFFTLAKITFSLLCTHFIYNMGLDLYNEGKLSTFRKKNVVISSVLKIWIDHVEIMGAILFFPINWSYILKDFLKYLFLLSTKIGDTLPLECLKASLKSNLDVIYFKLLLVAIYPFVIMLINFIYVLFLSMIKTAKHDKRFLLFHTTTKLPYLHLFPTVFFSVLLLCYSDVMKVCLEMVEYIDIGDSNNNDYRLVSDGNVVFDSPNYRFWFFRLDLPLLIFYGIMFPVSIFAYLFFKYQKSTIFSPLTLLKFSLFYYAFDKKHLFWEIIIILRKALLVFIQLYSFSSTDYKDLYPLIAMMAVNLVAAGIQLYFRPYQSQFDDLNKIEFGSLISLSVTFYLGIYYSLPVVAGTVIPSYYNYIFIILGALANLMFLFKIVEVVIKFLWEKEETYVGESIKIESNSMTEFKTSLIKLKVCKEESLDKSESCRNSRSMMVGSGDESANNLNNTDKSSKNTIITTDEKMKTQSHSFFPQPLMRPLTVIDEQISQEKIYRTYINIKGHSENISKKFEKEYLNKIFEWNRKNHDYEKTMNKSQEIYDEIKKNEGRFDNNEKMETVFEFYKDLDNRENAQFESIGYNYIFLEENENFYDVCLNNDKVFVETNLFKIKASYSLVGDLTSLIFVKLMLYFTAETEITQFEFDLKRHEGKTDKFVYLP